MPILVNSYPIVILSGLIVGSIIKYTSPGNASTSSSAMAYLSFSYNTSASPFVPPDYLKVKVSDDANATYYQYSLVVRNPSSQSVSEPELDEMVKYFKSNL